MIDIEITCSKSESGGWDNKNLRALTDEIEELCREKGFYFETKMCHGSGKTYYQGYRIKVDDNG